MQYILNQEEYDEYQALRKAASKTLSTEDMQYLCTTIAETTPVLHYGRGEPKPWGCMLSVPKPTSYCDCCPVKRICPSKKKYSK